MLSHCTLKDATKYNQTQFSESNFIEPTSEETPPQTGPGRTVVLDSSVNNEVDELLPNLPATNPIATGPTLNTATPGDSSPGTEENDEQPPSLSDNQPTNIEQVAAVNYKVNILDGQNDVEVNQPFIMDILSGISTEDASIDNSYFADSEGTVLYSRIEVRPNQIILIPQIKLQPAKQYTVIIGGLKKISTNETFSLSFTFQNKDLDHGLYWFGKHGLCEKYFPGINNAFYNPSQKTVIFSHGHQADFIKREDPYGRNDFSFEMFYWSEDNFGGDSSHNGLKQYTNHSWIDKSWNTGMVYWTQFADEPILSEGNFLGVYAAEAKVWSFNGPNGNRYRTHDSNGNPTYKNFTKQITFNGTTVNVNSAGQLLSLPVLHALKRNTSSNIRLVGHSLGAQMITQLANFIHEENILINRIALLDPAWTERSQSYLPVIKAVDTGTFANHTDEYAVYSGRIGKHFSTGEFSRKLLFRIMNDNEADGFAFEIYHTTLLNGPIPILDSNPPLRRAAADMNNAPWYYGATQIGPKHVVIRHHYFWSMASEPPTECTIRFWQRSKTGKVSGSAATNDERIREMMLNEFFWTQVEGRFTPDPADDWFERKKKW